MVAGFTEVIESEETLVAEARYVPNTQFLSIPFRGELIHSAAQVSELSDCTRGFVEPETRGASPQDSHKRVYRD